MDRQIQEIGQRLKELRDIRGVSLESCAKEMGLSPDTLKSYEEGKSDIPVSFLMQAATKFGVELTSLITGGEPHLTRFSLVKKGKGLAANRREEYLYEDLAYNFRNKKLEVLLVTVAPGKGSQKTYSHPGQEMNYMLSGKMAVEISGHEVILESGDTLYFDASQEHRMRALDNQTAKFLAVVL